MGKSIWTAITKKCERVVKNVDGEKEKGICTGHMPFLRSSIVSGRSVQRQMHSESAKLPFDIHKSHSAFIRIKRRIHVKFHAL